MRKNNIIKILEDSILINSKILVFSDLHLGLEDVSLDGLFPRIQLKEIKEKLDRIFKYLEKNNIKLEKIIILGDLKHDFGKIHNSEWREILAFLNYLDKKSKETKIFIIKGNHDKIIEPILKKKDICLLDYYIFENMGFLHGDRVIENCLINSKSLFIGHLHPSITLTDSNKKEKYKCFLTGKWKNKEVYILPSFSVVSEGYNLSQVDNKGEFFIINRKNIKNFEVVIYNPKEDKEYNFGVLKRIV